MLILFSFPLSSQHISPRTTTSESPKAHSKLWTSPPCSPATTSNSTLTPLSSLPSSSALAMPNNPSATLPSDSSSCSCRSLLPATPHLCLESQELGLMDLPPPMLLGSLIWDGFDGSPTPLPPISFSLSFGIGLMGSNGGWLF